MELPHTANRMELVKPSAIREFLKFGSDPGIISFAGGYPDATLFPTKELHEVYQSAILDQGTVSLQYTASNGIPRLREQIAARMTRDGTPCGADDILILQGSQQGLDLAAKMFIDKGDIIVTEDPTFLGALIAFNPYEPAYCAIGMDNEGMLTDELQRRLAGGLKPKLLYTVPDFQNPTGVTMSVARRKHLVALANQYNFMIIEDSPYREVRYDGAHMPTLKSLDTEGRVIFHGSFSKVLAPAMRLGWALASEDIIEKLGLLKLAVDTQCSTLNMTAASLYMERYDLDAHVKVLRAAYRRKKNLMLDAIRQYFPQEVTFSDPDGGLFTWLRFPDGFDTGKFMREQAFPVAKVAYVPGATFFPVQQQHNFARLNYSSQSDENIEKGMAALGKLIKQDLGKS